MTNSVDPEVSPKPHRLRGVPRGLGWCYTFVGVRSAATLGVVTIRPASTLASYEGFKPPCHPKFEPGEDWFWSFQTKDTWKVFAPLPRSIIPSTNLYLGRPDGSRPTGKTSERGVMRRWVAMVPPPRPKPGSSPAVLAALDGSWRGLRSTAGPRRRHRPPPATTRRTSRGLAEGKFERSH